MARINLSVPDDLKSKMHSIGLNWSAIAQEAFIKEIKNAERAEDFLRKIRATHPEIVEIRLRNGLRVRIDATRGQPATTQEHST